MLTKKDVSTLACLAGAQAILILAGATSQASDTEMKSLENADLSRCAVRIRSERREDGMLCTGHGTAFGIDLSKFGFSGPRFLLSAAHNVRDGKKEIYTNLKIEIRDIKEKSHWSACSVVAYDPGLDICLLEASEDLPAIAELAEKDPVLGGALFLAGSPRGIPISLFKGTLIRRFIDGSVNSLARIPFDHGDSGGPIFDGQTEKVTGVAVAGVPKGNDLDNEVGLFVPLAGIVSFMESYGKSASTGALLPAEVIENYQPASKRSVSVTPSNLQNQSVEAKLVQSGPDANSNESGFSFPMQNRE